VFLTEKQYKIRIILELCKFKRADYIINYLSMFSGSLDLFVCLNIINTELIYSTFEESYRTNKFHTKTQEIIHFFLVDDNSTSSPAQKLTILNALYEAYCKYGIYYQYSK